MTIEIVRELPAEEWSRFVMDHGEGNIFHTPDMFRVFSRTKNHRPELWAAAQNGHLLALFLPVQIRLKRAWPRRLTTRSVVYGSILCEPGETGQEALDQLLRAYVRRPRQDSLFTELRHLSDHRDLMPILERHGFVHENHLNYLIHLDRPEDELFRSIGSRTRKNIRHGLNQGQVTVEELTDRKQVASCYDVLRQTYKAARVPLADISLFESAFDLLYAKGMARFSLAYLDRTPAAVSVDLLYKDIIYGWYGGVNRDCGRQPVHELLMWHILRWGSQNGFGVYDFGGAGKPDEKYGVRDFKSKFGGGLVDYGRHICVHSRRLLWLSEKGYRLFRRWL